MQLTIFVKNKTTKAGKPFHIFLSTLTTKTGEKVPVRVCFKMQSSGGQGEPDPASCPLVIDVDKNTANLSAESYNTDEGETRVARKLWVTNWTVVGKYEDHSLDEFE